MVAPTLFPQSEMSPSGGGGRSFGRSFNTRSNRTDALDLIFGAEEQHDRIIRQRAQSQAQSSELQQKIGGAIAGAAPIVGSVASGFEKRSAADRVQRRGKQGAFRILDIAREQARDIHEVGTLRRGAQRAAFGAAGVEGSVVGQVAEIDADRDIRQANEIQEIAMAEAITLHNRSRRRAKRLRRSATVDFSIAGLQTLGLAVGLTA